MKKQTFIRITLGFVVMIVWGYNILKFINNTNQDVPLLPIYSTPDSMLYSQEVPLDSLSEIYYVYWGGYRDPFRPDFMVNTTNTDIQPKKDKIPPSLVQKPIKLESPHFRYKGILSDYTLTTAVIENEQGDTFFIEQTDTLEGVLIQKISPDSLICMFQKSTVIYRTDY